MRWAVEVRIDREGWTRRLVCSVGAKDMGMIVGELDYTCWLVGFNLFLPGSSLLPVYWGVKLHLLCLTLYLIRLKKGGENE